MRLQFTLLDLYSFSIGIAAIISWIRFRQINRIYHPFLYCIWLAFINEIIGYFMIYSGNYNSLNNNLYVLAESLLITWQFRRWQVFDRRRWLYRGILILFLLSWLTDAFFISGLSHPITWFRLLFSFVIVLMGIHRLNYILLTEKRSLLTNSIFLICTGFIIYFLYKVIIGVFWLYSFGGSVELERSTVWILIYINVLSNLIYAYAVLWMPKKHHFSLPF